LLGNSSISTQLPRSWRHWVHVEDPEVWSSSIDPSFWRAEWSRVLVHGECACKDHMQGGLLALVVQTSSNQIVQTGGTFSHQMPLSPSMIVVSLSLSAPRSWIGGFKMVRSRCSKCQHKVRALELLLATCKQLCACKSLCKNGMPHVS
jgi:hypothetical protein